MSTKEFPSDAYPEITAPELACIPEIAKASLLRGVATMYLVKDIQDDILSPSRSNWARQDFPIPKDHHLYYWLDRTQFTTEQNFIEGLNTAIAYARNSAIDEHFSRLTIQHSLKIPDEMETDAESLAKYLAMLVDSKDSQINQAIPTKLYKVLETARQEIQAEQEFLDNMSSLPPALQNKLSSNRTKRQQHLDLLKTQEKLPDILIESLSAKGSLIAVDDSLITTKHTFQGNFHPGELITSHRQPIPFNAITAIIPLSQRDSKMISNAMIDPKHKGKIIQLR